MNRRQTRVSMAGAITHNALATKHAAVPAMRGRRRPYRSESCPMTSCPLAKPIRNAVIVNWIDDVDARSSYAISGNADRYMSIENGATAVAAASTAIKTGDTGVCRGESSVRQG